MDIHEPSAFEAESDPQQSISLREFLSVLQRRKVVISYTALSIIILGIAITLLTPPTYRATSSLLIQPNSLQLNSVDASNPLSDLFTAAPGYKIETQVRLLQSEDLVEKVKKKLSISARDSVDINAKAILETDIIEVSVDSGTAKTAKNIANELIDTYLDQTADINGKSVRDALKFTDKEAKKAQKDLEIAESKLRQFQQKNNVSELDKNREIQITAAQALGDRYKEQQAKLAATKSQLATLRATMAREPRTTSTVLSVEADPAIQATEQKLAALDADRAGLLQRYTTVNKQVVAIDAQIATLRKFLLTQRAQAPLRNETKNPVYDALRARHDLLEEQASGLAAEAAATARNLQIANSRLGAFPAWQQQMARLQRQMEIAKASYAFLSAKREDLRLRDQTRHVGARVMEYASDPTAPIRPKKAVNIALSIILGLFVALILAFLQEFLDDRIHSQEESERLFQLPTLGTVPLIEEVGIRVIRNVTAFSPLIEAYRGLRTNIGFAAVDAPIRNLMVTSTAPSEGKSTITANLAIAMAIDHKNVILVDADLRRPTQHKILNLKHTPGLSDVLLGTHTLESVLQETFADGVRLLSAGTPAPNPAELLASEAMGRLLAELETLADIVIIDTPADPGRLRLGDAFGAGRWGSLRGEPCRDQERQRPAGDQIAHPRPGKSSWCRTE